MTVKEMTITDVVRMPVEEISEKRAEEKQELLSIVEQSQARAGKKRAQLIRDLMKADNKKSGKKSRKKPEPVENSTKAPKKPKQEKKAEPKQGKKSEPKSKKKAKLKKPNLEELPEEARKYIEELERKSSEAHAEKFPEQIEAEKVVYNQIQVKDVQELRKIIIENPYQIHMFLDEHLEELTQTLVLLSNKDVTVLFDQSREVNSTINILNSKINFRDGIIKPEVKGDPQAEFSVYMKEPKK